MLKQKVFDSRKEICDFVNKTKVKPVSVICHGNMFAISYVLFYEE